MTLTQYLCQLLSEECSELAQRASKLSRFGTVTDNLMLATGNYVRLHLHGIDCAASGYLMKDTVMNRTLLSVAILTPLISTSLMFI